jgi:hypothetical protein
LGGSFPEQFMTTAEWRISVPMVQEPSIPSAMRTAAAASRLKVGRRLRAVHVERPNRLYFNGFGNRLGIFKFNAQIPDCAVHLAVTQQKLNSTQVAGLLVNLSDLCPAHGMRPVTVLNGGIEPMMPKFTNYQCWAQSVMVVAYQHEK